MFDFQKLEVYQKAKLFNKETSVLLLNKKFDRITNDQLRRASFSIMLNIAEGMSRFSNKDRRNFMVISRGSAFECVAIFEYLVDNQQLEQEKYNELYFKLEELSKMLFALIRRLEN